MSEPSTQVIYPDLPPTSVCIHSRSHPVEPGRGDSLPRCNRAGFFSVYCVRVHAFFWAVSRLPRPMSSGSKVVKGSVGWNDLQSVGMIVFPGE